MTLVYLLVPVETEFDERDKIQGRSDAKWAKTAEARIPSLKHILQTLDLKTAYISPQERAIYTSELANLTIKAEINNLMDWDFGVFEAQRNFLLPKLPADDYGDFFKRYGYGGETASEVNQRLEKAIFAVKKEAQADKLLLISGQHAIYNFYLQHTDEAKRNLRKADFEPCSLHAFTVTDDKITYNQSYFCTLAPEQLNAVPNESEYVQW